MFWKWLGGVNQQTITWTEGNKEHRVVELYGITSKMSELISHWKLFEIIYFETNFNLCLPEYCVSQWLLVKVSRFLW